MLNIKHIADAYAFSKQLTFSCAKADYTCLFNKYSQVCVLLNELVSVYSFDVPDTIINIHYLNRSQTVALMPCLQATDNQQNLNLGNNRPLLHVVVHGLEPRHKSYGLTPHGENI